MLAALAVALSFLTMFPAPRAEWTPQSLRYFPIAAPLVGAAIGELWALAFSVLCLWDVSPLLRAVLMTLGCLAVTGGLHMDGLMDTCDAVFSRKGREERLAILSDTHVGAFAVMGCSAALMLKAGIFSELFEHSNLERTFALALVPVYSRLGLGLLLFLPFAKEDGLARTLGAARVPKDRVILLVCYALLSILSLPFGVKFFSIPLVSVIALALYSRYCVKIFGGITGDLIGAYVELSEILMLLAEAA